MVQQMRYTFTLYSVKAGFLCAAVNLKLLVMVGQETVMVGQMPTLGYATDTMEPHQYGEQCTL